MLAASDGQETHEGNLHASKRTERIPRGIADIETRAVASHADEHESVQRQQVGNENVSTPSGDHVAVEERTERTPESRSVLQSLDP